MPTMSYDHSHRTLSYPSRPGALALVHLRRPTRGGLPRLGAARHHRPDALVASDRARRGTGRASRATDPGCDAVRFTHLVLNHPRPAAGAVVLRRLHRPDR